MNFQRLNLIEPILRALKEESYQTPTPIQVQAIPQALAGRDLLACAQTGTGKTAAFAIPILQNLHEQHISRNKPKLIKALVLTPTRELAIQIGDSFTAYGRHVRLRNLVVFGGVSQNPQVADLRRGVDILVATPGRLLDLMNQGIINLEHIELFVLDEADRMLDMGFIHDVKRVIKALPKKRQTLFFSATMPPEIAALANDILTDPVKVAVTPVSSTVEAIEQAVFFVEKNKKKDLLLHLLRGDKITSALVFTRTKHGANRVVKDLARAGVDAQAIHGNKSQTARQTALNNFKTGGIRVLVATDIAARGIDLEHLSHVINFDLPNVPETYVHRIGRTGRAGASGIAFSFCDREEKAYLKDIQRLINRQIPVVENHPFPLGSPPAPIAEETSSKERQNGGHRRSPAGGNPPPRPSTPGRSDSLPAPSNDNTRKQQQEKSPSLPSSPSFGDNKRGKRRPAPQRTNQQERRSQNAPQTTTNFEKNYDDRRSKQNQATPKAPKEGVHPRPESGSSEKTEVNKGKWSSIFLKPVSGGKGFVIKSDRDERPKKQQNRDRRPFQRRKK